MLVTASKPDLFLPVEAQGHLRLDAPTGRTLELIAEGDTLRVCVTRALERYLATLDGHDCTDLFRLVVAEVEAPMLECVLRHTRGNQSRAAEMLGINRATLRKKCRQYGIE